MKQAETTAVQTFNRTIVELKSGYVDGAFSDGILLIVP